MPLASATRRRRARGFSLVELMVSLVAGLLLVAAISALFANIIQAQRSTLQVSRLNQELQAVMDLIARDVQRAGFDANANAFLAAAPGVRSPFYFASTSDLQQETPSGSQVFHCLRIRYDDNSDGVLNSNESWLFNFDSTTQTVRRDPSSCTAGSDLTDPNTVLITALNFRLTPNTVAQKARAVRVNLSGALKKHPAITLTLQRDIKLRNDGY
ncbi:MAG: PilW family protein [Aeromonas sp.]